MRFRDIDATDILPIKRFHVANLADVVVLAGRNGVGKTRLVDAIIQSLSKPGQSQSICLTVEATTQAERNIWGKGLLVTSDAIDAKALTDYLRMDRRRANWEGSILQFDSDRTIRNVKRYNFRWDVGDPDNETFGWNQTFRPLSVRFEDTLHSIFRKVQERRNRIARTAEDLIADGQKSMALDFDDPFQPFKEAFKQLLGPKRLVDPDARLQTLQYEHEGSTYAFDTLSAGEQEVVNVVFDFLLRRPSDCVIFFDEPELHLHPELSYKLLQALQNVSRRNQFILCTHSPDIITASLDQSVVFIGPERQDNGNQALPVAHDDDTNEALKLLGQSVGIIALGKRLVLIEGHSASLDKQIYGLLIGAQFPELALVPSGACKKTCVS